MSDLTQAGMGSPGVPCNCGSEHDPAVLAAVFHAAADAIIVSDEQGQILMLNGAAELIFGRSARELVGRPLTLLMPSPDRETHDGSMQRYLRTGEARIIGREREVTGLRADGSLVPLALRVTECLAGGRRLFIGILQDVSESIRWRESLKKSEAMYRLLADGAKDVVYLARFIPTRVTEYVSPSIEALTGYSPESFYADPDLARRIVHPEDLPVLERWLASPELLANRRELRWIRRDGTVIWTEQQASLERDPSGRVAAVRGIMRDITERKAAEEELKRKDSQLLQPQKMEALGNLAAGISHDFNNLLTVINGYSDLMLSRSPADWPQRTELAEVRRAGDRAAALVRQILAFARRQVLQPRVVDLNEVVTSMTPMLRRVIVETIDLSTSLPDRPATAMVDPGQMEQVLVNLVVNARDAMPAGGRLEIAVRLGRYDGDEHCSEPIPPGPYAVLEVSDTGCGMTAEVRARIFEPFFTTKGPGLGSGLGLSTVHGIVRQTGGFIAVESSPGKGTIFRVYLPWVDQPVARLNGATPVTVSLRGSETILVAEDCEEVALLIRNVLAHNGYSVLPARDGIDALRVLDSFDGPVPLAITDLVMPRPENVSLGEALRARRPGMRVLLISGYSDEVHRQPASPESGSSFLGKPFTPKQLLTAVRELLDRKP